MASNYDEVLRKGDMVEVSSNDQGLRGSWFTATVLRSCSRKNKKIFLEYHRLFSDDAGTKPLREFIDCLLVRPVPPREPQGSVLFAIDDDVDAFHNDGWWEGVVTEVLEGLRYSVFFRCSREQIQFSAQELRVHREWVDGDWVPPLVEEQPAPPPQSSSQNPGSGSQRERRKSSSGGSSKGCIWCYGQHNTRRHKNKTRVFGALMDSTQPIKMDKNQLQKVGITHSPGSPVNISRVRGLIGHNLLVSEDADTC